MRQELVCQKTKCSDYLTDDGEPAWCYRAGQPAQVAVRKCPKLENKKPHDEDKEERKA